MGYFCSINCPADFGAFEGVWLVRIDVMPASTPMVLQRRSTLLYSMTCPLYLPCVAEQGNTVHKIVAKSSRNIVATVIKVITQVTSALCDGIQINDQKLFVFRYGGKCA